MLSIYGQVRGSLLVGGVRMEIALKIVLVIASIGLILAVLQRLTMALAVIFFVLTIVVAYFVRSA
jgi:preprotein translocase subunit SecG